MSASIDIGAIQSTTIDIGAIQNTAGATPVNKLVADSITISDGFALNATISQSLSDAISLTDVQTIYGPDDSNPFIFTDDFFTLSDSVSTFLSSLGFLTATASDSITITDSVSGAFAGIFISVSDALVFLDNWNYLFASAADSFALSDQLVGLLITILIQQSDSISLTDAFQVLDLSSADSSTIEGPPLGDSLTLSDGISDTVGIPISHSDSISISDAESLVGADILNLSDSLTFTDAVLAANPQGIAVSDFISLIDFFQLLKSGSFSPVSADTVTISDSASLVLQQEGTPQSDQVLFTDTVQLILAIDLNLNDSLTLTDKDVNDNVNSPTINKSFSDTVLVTDFVIVQDGINIYLSDPFALSDGLAIMDGVTISVQSDLNPYLRRYLNDVIPN